jgi:hypothetical protein
MQRAKESHDLAATAAYDGLSNGDDSEDAYLSKASLVVQNQLLRAGRRLAKVLDENFDDQWRCSGAIQRGVDAQNCTIRETASLMGTRSREGGCHEERDALFGDIAIGSL